MERTTQELDTLAALLVSLAMFAGRAPTDNGAKEYSRQADDLAQRANRLGYPSIADAIYAAKAREVWSGRAEGLRAAASLARKLAGQTVVSGIPTNEGDTISVVTEV